MKVIQIYLNNSLRNFNYILYSEKTKEAIFFDPTDISVTLPFCKKLGITPKYLLNTHQHFDHIADNEKFLELPDTKHIKLEDGEEFELSDSEKLVCLHTPGHVMDHDCYLLMENGEGVGLISGDAIFNAGIGNCKNGGNVEVYFDTFKERILPLADNLVIYPSHDYFENNLQFAQTVDPANKVIDSYLDKVQALAKNGEFLLTTIGEEKKFNPFFRVFQSEFKKEQGLSEKDLFIQLRKKRDSW